MGRLGNWLRFLRSHTLAHKPVQHRPQLEALEERLAPASAGFTVREDTGMLDWNARFAQGKAFAWVRRGAYMRIAVARR